MKPSNLANIKMKSQTSVRGKRAAAAQLRVSTLYLAAGLLLLLVLLMTLGQGPLVAAAATSAPASKSADRLLPATGGRPSSSSSSSAPFEGAAAAADGDHHLALPSTTISSSSVASGAASQQRLMPISHKESQSVSSETTRTRSSDLSVGQSNIAHAKVHSSPQDMATAAGHHYGGGKGHGKYYMYAESPKKGAYKMGFKRGNHKHMIERKESAHKGHVSSYFKWHDKKGKGSHKFEFKHYDKKGKHYG